jgi:uncharacterized membrane-anchored protein
VSRRRRYAFFAVVTVLVLFPLATIAYNELKLATGEKVRLKTQPVDPIDFFRGRYVTLSYDISRVRMDGNPAPGTTVYVPLHEAGPYWTGDFASTIRPPSGRFIRGRVTDAAQVRYGIETYFVDEREARKYERAAASGDLYVDVVLDDGGKARIKELHIVRPDR